MEAPSPRPLSLSVHPRVLARYAVIGVSALLLYAVAFLWSSPAIGSGVTALSLALVVPAAALLGLGVGFGIAAFLLPFHALLFGLSGQDGWATVLQPFNMFFNLLSLLTAAVLGFLRDSYRRLSRQQQLERARFAAALAEEQRLTAAVQQQSDLYRLLSEASSDAVCLVDKNGRFVKVNQAALDLFGCTLDELSTLTIHAFYADPDDRDWVHQELQRGHEAAVKGIEVKVRRRNGAEVICTESDELWRDPSGNVLGYRVVLSDITWRKRAEEALRVGEEQLRLAMEAANMATWTFDVQTNTVTASETFDRLFGLPPGGFAGSFQALLDLVHIDDRPAFQRAIARAMEDTSALELEIRIVRPNGAIRWMAVRAIAVAGQASKTVRVVGTFIDITERKRAEEKVEQLGFYDPLTDLPNRRLFNDRLNVALAQARRSGKLVAVFFLDLDRFKVINDTLGHAAGDRLLQQVADRLTASVRPYDTVARQGGDEFMIIVPALDRAEEAEQIAQRILQAMEAPFNIAGRNLHVTTSIGISLFPEDGEGPEPLLRNADAAMYRVKASGRNGYRLHTPAMYTEVFRRLELETNLRQGLERDEFLVYYQPQVNLASNEIIGVEALVRWRRPDGELVPPADFIPVAEESGLIVPLDQWVLRTACAQLQRWRADGLPPLRLSVNIAAHHFQQANFVDVITAILQETRLEPHLLKLEITESTAMENVEHTRAVLQELTEIGVQASLDDFGTGHASLNYLKDFPLHALKIDRSFVSGLPNDARHAGITNAIIAVGHALNLEVVAEGVETPDQLEFLRLRECDTGQGYLFGHPVPAEEFGRLLRTRAPHLLAGRR